jgi:secreted trypsin-like serine protease
VGYGLLTFNGRRSRIRFNAPQELIELKDNSNDKDHAKFTSSFGNGGSACFGASGGPTFWNGNDDPVITSLVSAGSQNCGGNSVSYRLDVADALDFIEDEVGELLEM